MYAVNITIKLNAPKKATAGSGVSPAKSRLKLSHSCLSYCLPMRRSTNYWTTRSHNPDWAVSPPHRFRWVNTLDGDHGKLLVAVLLVIPRFRLFAFFGAFSLMVMFTAVHRGYSQFQHLCSVFLRRGVGKLGWTEHLYFNSVFILLV